MKKEFFKFLILLAVALGAPPAYSAMWQWSKTASNNATADPTINYSEGMSPSSVNDSARAAMARTAEWRDDISGLLVTGGSSTAYTVTTNQGLAAVPNDGQMIAVTMNVTNGNAPTLTADGGTAYPVQTSPGIAVPAATLVAGSPYTVKFSLSNSAWILRDFYSTALTIPLGAMVPYTGSVPPNSNFIIPTGQCLSTTTYAAYWVLLGSPASGGCAGGQFGIIDMRGRNPVGLDNLNGTAANRLTAGGGCGTAMTSIGASCVNGTESKNLAIANINSFTPTGSFSATLASGNAPVPQQGNSGVGSPITAAFSEGGNNKSPTVLNVAVSGSVSGAVSMNALGSGTAHPTVDPNTGVSYLLRIL